MDGMAEAEKQANLESEEINEAKSFENIEVESKVTFDRSARRARTMNLDDPSSTRVQGVSMNLLMEMPLTPKGKRGKSSDSPRNFVRRSNSTLSNLDTPKSNRGATNIFGFKPSNSPRNTFELSPTTKKRVFTGESDGYKKSATFPNFNNSFENDELLAAELGAAENATLKDVSKSPRDQDNDNKKQDDIFTFKDLQSEIAKNQERVIY